MVKKHPSKPLLVALTGNRSNILSSIHHGLADVSLAEFYPVLDLEEALAFAIGSYHDRCHNNSNENNQSYMNKIREMSAYELFNHYLSSDVHPRREGDRMTPQGTIPTPYSWLRSHVELNDRHKTQYDKMNSESDSLEDRLAKVDDESLGKLKNALCRMPNEYVFECKYRQRKAEKGTNHGLEIMRFQDYFPNSKNIPGKFAGEIAKILKTYPQELPEPKGLTLLEMYNKEIEAIPANVREYCESCGLDPRDAHNYDLSGMPSEEL